MALDDLAHVHKLAQERSWARWRAAENNIAGLSCGQMVAHWANATDTRGNLGHFLYQPAFAEFLEAAEFVYMEVGMLH